jgi:hypothetical protein
VEKIRQTPGEDKSEREQKGKRNGFQRIAGAYL